MNYAKTPETKNIILKALREDIGKKDITTAMIIPKDKRVKAALLAKENCTICGIALAGEIFKTQDKGIKFKSVFSDGQKIKNGQIIAYIEGKARSILAAERVALNFLSLLSGIATKTRTYTDKVKPFKVKILDTRKTIPGLRELEKYAVRIGGGFNHRFSLDEMILIKDNHLIVSCAMRPAQCIKKIIKNIKKKLSKNIKLEIEVKNLKEFQEALRENPDIIMLDNMKISDIKKAVALERNTHDAIRTTLIEASGGITLKNIRKIASCGVDMISIGALTHSVSSVDISLEFL